MKIQPVSEAERSELVKYYNNKWGCITDVHWAFKIEGYMPDSPSWCGDCYLVFWGEICYTELLTVEDTDYTDWDNPKDLTNLPLHQRLHGCLVGGSLETILGEVDEIKKAVNLSDRKAILNHADNIRKTIKDESSFYVE